MSNQQQTGIGFSGSPLGGSNTAGIMYNDFFGEGDLGASTDIFDSARKQQTQQAQANLKRTQEMEAYAAQVSQQSNEDSLKIGLANLLAKAKNMQTQAHLSLAKEAIEVAKSSV
jgi:hypothetical protein